MLKGTLLLSALFAVVLSEAVVISWVHAEEGNAQPVPRDEGNNRNLAERVERLENEVEALKSQFTALHPKAEEDTRETRISRILGLSNHMQTAFSVGPELTRLEPDEGVAIVQEAWPQIELTEVKTGLLKAFAFSKALAPRKHPKLLQVLHLGMTDPNPEVRQYAASYLKEYSKEDLSGDLDRYAKWFEQYGDLPLDEVVRLNNKRESPADVADVPAESRLAESNERMRYFLIGPYKDAPPPKDGYKLVVIMPGGDGSADFHEFVRRIYKNSLGNDFLAAEPVAFKWQPKQEIVWPTRTNKVEGQEFSTEDFVEAVIHDVSQKYPINRESVYTLSWSSSGPAAYAISLAEDTPVKGSYIAMSVFVPSTLPAAKSAEGHAYFLDHSPDDRVCPFLMAKAAKKTLEENGATVKLSTYSGGHGWHGDVFSRVRQGIDWLDSQSNQGE